jgi:hypothetical protein
MPRGLPRYGLSKYCDGSSSGLDSAVRFLMERTGTGALARRNPHASGTPGSPCRGRMPIRAQACCGVEVWGTSTCAELVLHARLRALDLYGNLARRSQGAGGLVETHLWFDQQLGVVQASSRDRIRTGILQQILLRASISTHDSCIGTHS